MNRYYVKRTGYQTAAEINATMHPDSRSGFLGAGRVTFDVIDRVTKSIAVNNAGNLCTGMNRGLADNMAKNLNMDEASGMRDRLRAAGKLNG